MISSLVEAAIRFRILVLGITVALFFFGAIQLRDMPIDILPEFAPPTVEIQTEAPGLSAAEIELMVSLGIEGLMSGLPWVQSLSSKSVAGLSSIKMVFDPGTDLLRARQLVHERLTGAFLLPSVGKPPIMQPPTSSTNRVLMVALSSQVVDPIALSVVAQWTVKPKLLGVPGVSKVAIWGARPRQLQILLDYNKLQKYGIKQNQIIKAAGESLWVSNLSFLKSSVPGRGGFLDSPNQRMEVRHVLPISSPADLARIRIGGTKYKLGDVAQVVEGHPPLIGDAIVKDGHGLLLVVEKYPGANTVEVTRAVEAALDEMRPGLVDINIDSHAFRPATFVQWAMTNIAKAVLIGGLLSVLAMALLLFNWRALAVGVIAIPLSLLLAALVNYEEGATLNTLMLSGFGVAIASIIDDLVITFQNLRRRLLLSDGKPAGGIAVGTIIRDSIAETRRPVIFATLINLLVISPVFFLKGLTGSFIQPLAISYMLALLASLLVAVTVVPAFAALLSVWLRPAATPQHEGQPATKPRRAGLFALPLGAISSRPIAAGLVAAALAAIMLFTLPRFSNVTLPHFKERDVLVNWDMPVGVSQSEMFRITSKATRELRAVAGVRDVAAHFGRAVSGDQTVGLNSGRIWIRIDHKADYNRTLAEIQSTISAYPGVRHKLHTYLNDRMGRALPSQKNDLIVRVYGGNRKIILETAGKVKEALSGVEGLWDLRVDDVPLEPHIQVEVNLAAAAQIGIKPGDVRRAASTLFAGLEVGRIYESQKVFSVVVWSKPDQRASVSDIANALIAVPGGGYVRLADVASIKVVETPSLVRRESNSQYIDVIASVGGRSYDAVISDARQRLRNVSFRLGYYPKIMGEAESQRAALARLGVAALVAAIGIGLLLQAATGSWLLALALLLTLPLALSGGMLAALLSEAGGAISLGSLLGLLAVYGLATRQGLTMAYRYHQLLDQAGSNPDTTASAELAASATQERIVPVVVTALCVALAMAPLVYFGSRPGFELLRPMATVVLGGLVSSTITVLLVLPAVFLRFSANREPELNLGVTR